MDVHCTTCGEPWDTYHRQHDAIWETGCPPDANADPALLNAKSEIEAMLGDDEDGLAAEFNELGV